MNLKIPLISDYKTVILADGELPVHPIPKKLLLEAERVVCCDGAAAAAIEYGIEPECIIGDLDSLSLDLQRKYFNRMHQDVNDEFNDLTKAVNHCIKKHWREITIVGATGKREDHSLGNISLTADYAEMAKIQLVTNYGTFVPILESANFESFAGQQVSIFSMNPETLITSAGLKYPLTKQNLKKWWQGTLNESTGDAFEIKINAGKVLIFRNF